MKRYCLIQRNDRGGIFYAHDQETGKRESLKTSRKAAAEQIISAKNEALRQPALNLQLAKAYLLGADKRIGTRTWEDVFEALIHTKTGNTQARWQRARREKPFELIRNKPLIDTRAEDFLLVLRTGSVSTNVHLRKLHNFALNMDWLPKPVLPKLEWPAIKFREKRAITLEEHSKIIDLEVNPERKAFYELCWLLGGSQGDIISLRGEDIDWQDRTLAYAR
jgi:integrase